MKKLKIGIVVDQLLAGGVQLAAIEQVRELNKFGHQAKLLILMRKKYISDFSYLVKDIPHQFLSDEYPPIFRKTFKFPVFSFFSTLHLISPILAPTVVKKGDFDILISLGSTTCITTQAIYKKNKIPYIAVIHDPFIYILDKCYSKTFLRVFFPILKPLVKHFETAFVKDAKETIIISRVHSKFIKKNYRILPKILSFGTKTLKKLPKKRGECLLSFGRWQNEKNPEFLLNLVKKITGSKLIIAGSWINNDEYKQFKAKIEKEKLTERVELIPYYTQKQLSKLCAKARLWLHPHFEAFGLAGLEAAGYGLPIIIPRRSGVTEHFTHGVHGYFPKKVNLSEYSKYIRRLLADGTLAYKMGKAAWQKVKDDLSWEANTKNLLKLVYLALGETQKTHICVLETGHILGGTLAGGDKLMEPMAIKLAQKYQFTIIAPEIGSNHWKEAPLVKELKILPSNFFDSFSSPIPVFITYCLRMIQTIKTLVRLKNIDIIYSSTNVLPDILPAFFVYNKHRALWIARVHHLIPPPQKREGRFLVNFVSYLMQIVSLFMIRSRADIIIALNDQLKNDLIKMGFSRGKLQVLGAGIDFKKIASQKILPNTPSFEGIFLGRLHPSKGIFDLIPIWREVVKDIPSAKLAIIGGGQEYLKEQLQFLIDKENLSSNIHLLGYLPDKKVYSIVKKSRVFLFTDHEAGWGLAVAEAMACGLPVVGWDIGILGTVFKSGFLKAPQSNFGYLATLIIKILKNKNLNQKLKKEATTEASRFNWAQTSEQFEKMLEQVYPFVFTNAAKVKT